MAGEEPPGLKFPLIDLHSFKEVILEQFKFGGRVEDVLLVQLTGCDHIERIGCENVQRVVVLVADM